MPSDIAWRVLRVQIMERYHLSFKQIDNLSLEDLGDILGYQTEKGRVEAANADKRKRLGDKG